MQLVILGSGSCAPTARRGSSGAVILRETGHILLDGGAAVVEKMVQAHIRYQDVDYIFYSHLHADHTAGIIPFLFATNYTPGFTREKPLHIFGPKGIDEFFGKLITLYPHLKADAYELIIKELEDDEMDLGAFKVKSLPVVHAGLNALAYRFEFEDGTIAYSGDTDVCDNAVKIAEGADLYLIEAAYPDQYKVQGHLTPRTAGQIAQSAGVKRIVLTHMYEVCDSYDMRSQAKEVFQGDVIVGEDLMRIIF